MVQTKLMGELLNAMRRELRQGHRCPLCLEKITQPTGADLRDAADKIVRYLDLSIVATREQIAGQITARCADSALDIILKVLCDAGVVTETAKGSNIYQIALRMKEEAE